MARLIGDDWRFVYRVYLIEASGHWRDFGLDYASKADAERVAEQYRTTFPDLVYRSRGTWCKPHPGRADAMASV